MRRLNRVSTGEQGYTLIGMLTALVISAILLGAAFSLLKASFAAVSSGQRMMWAQENATLGMEWMVKRLRLAGYGITSPQQPIVLAQPNEIQFNTDLDGAGGAETIHYNLTALGVLEEGIRNPAEPTFTYRPLTDPAIAVTSLQFTYSPSSIPSQVQRIAITIAVDADRNGTVDFTLTTEVRPRNIGLQ